MTLSRVYAGNSRSITISIPPITSISTLSGASATPTARGVMAGITQIGNVQGYYIQDGERVPMEGRLIYRGISIEDLIHGFMSEGRFGFEETAYLLLFGALPTRKELADFNHVLSRAAPPAAQLHRGYDPPGAGPGHHEPPGPMHPGPSTAMTRTRRAGPWENELRQALQLVARCPMIIAHSYAAKRHYFDNDSLYLHRPQEGLSFAENFLYAMRHDNRFTEREAKLLDLCMVSMPSTAAATTPPFACRALSSSGTDIYAAVSAAVGVPEGLATAAPTRRSWRCSAISRRASGTGRTTGQCGFPS